MAFSISFLDRPAIYPNPGDTSPTVFGSLVLGGEEQTFLIPLREWSQADYERQWHGAIAAMLAGGETGALMIAYRSPRAGTHLEWWTWYREGEAVSFQRHLLFYKDLAEPFALERAHLFVADRNLKSAVGPSAKEWSVPLEEVRSFAAARGVGVS